MPSRRRSASSGPSDEASEPLGALERRPVGGSTGRGEDDREAAEPAGPRAFEQREPVVGVGRQQGGGAPGECRRDGLLEARLDLERRDREPLSRSRQHAGGGGDAFPVCERPLERGEPLPRRARTLDEVVALAGGRAGDRAGIVRALLQLDRARRTAPGARAGGGVLFPEPPGERGRALVASAKSLAGRAERDESPVRLAVAAGELAEPPVDRLPLEADRLQAALRLVRRGSLGRGEQGVRVAGALGGLAALECSVAGRGAGGPGRLLEGSKRLVASGSLGPPGLVQVFPQPSGHPADRLLAHREALSGALQSVEGSDGRLPGARRVGELDLRALALREDGGEPLLCGSSREGRGGPALLRLGPPALEHGQIQPGDARPQARDLVGELLGTLGRRRLERQRAQPLAHLLLDVPRALGLRSDTGKLELGAVTPALELAEAGRLLDKGAPVLRLRGEHGFDLPLADDRVHGAAEADVRKQLDQVGASHRRAVDEVLALSPAREAARDRDLAEVELRAEAAVLVVEHELDLAVIGRCAGRRAAEEDVVRLLGAHLGRCQRARRPHDRVGDVRLPRAVRPDDDRDPGLEAHLDRIGERLEAAQLDRAQVHRR